MIEWDETDPERPIAIVDVRVLRRDVRAGHRPRPRRGARQRRLPRCAERLASGPFELDAAIPLDDIRAAAADGPEGLLPLLRPIDDGLDAFPVIELTDVELAAVARGQFVRPVAGIAGRAPTTTGCAAPDGRLAAIASGRRHAPRAREGLRESGGRAAPARPASAWTSSRGSSDWRPGSVRSSSSSASSMVCISATPTCCGTWSPRRHGATPRPTVITFDHHPDEVLVGNAPPLLIDPDERLERLAAAGVAVTVVQHFDDEPAADHLRHVRRADPRRGSSCAASS